MDEKYMHMDCGAWCDAYGCDSGQCGMPSGWMFYACPFEAEQDISGNGNRPAAADDEE